MTTLSSSPSFSSENEGTTTRTRDISETSESIQQTIPRYHEGSATNTVDHTSIAGTTTVRSSSPTISQRSAGTTGTSYDAVSLATTTNTGFTNTTGVTGNTAVSQQQVANRIPTIRPPIPQQQPSGIGTNVANQRIQMDVASAHQQYQQGGSNTSSSGASLQQQPRFDANKAVFNQADTNRDGGISGGNQTSGQFHYQQQQRQAQFGNQISGQPVLNELLGADAFKDVTLNIDYGVIEAYNIGMQSASDITAEQLQASSNVGGGQQFDVVKAMFNQADTNRDGGISREEFRHWAQGANQNVGGQSYSNYQTTSTTNYGNNFNHAQIYTGASPEVANILQQSGLGQGYTNYG